MSEKKTDCKRLATACPLTVFCVALQYYLFSRSAALLFGRMHVALAAAFSLAFMCMPTAMTGVINSIAFRGMRKYKVFNCAASGIVVTAAAVILFTRMYVPLARSTLFVTWLWYMGGLFSLLLFYLTGFIGQKLKNSAPPQYVMKD